LNIRTTFSIRRWWWAPRTPSARLWPSPPWTFGPRLAWV
jgi:hypothetical protein